MKKLAVLFIILIFSLSVYAKTSVKRVNKYPQGVFKKSWNGDIIQYDIKGRKTGIYKIKNGNAVKIK